MRVSREKWKELALQGAELISTSGLLAPLDGTDTATVDCPYYAFCVDIMAAAANDFYGQKARAQKKAKAPALVKSPYLPNQLQFSFEH